MDLEDYRVHPDQGYVDFRGCMSPTAAHRGHQIVEEVLLQYLLETMEGWASRLDAINQDL
jgi:hypothetical protein